MTPLVDPVVQTSQVTSQIPQLDNRPTEAPQAVQETTPMDTPPIVVESPERPLPRVRGPQYRMTTVAPKEQVQNQSVKPSFQAKQLKEPAYLGLPTNLLAPYEEGSLEALAKTKARQQAEGMEMRLFFNDETKEWETRMVSEMFGAGNVTTTNAAQKEQLLTIYDTMMEEQNKKYSKLITELPTMEDSMLENLVVAREAFPYEIRQMILDEYKMRINYYDRLRNPQNYPGEPSPLLPRAGTTLEGE